MPASKTTFLYILQPGQWLFLIFFPFLYSPMFFVARSSYRKEDAEKKVWHFAYIFFGDQLYHCSRKNKSRKLIISSRCTASSANLSQCLTFSFSSEHYGQCQWQISDKLIKFGSDTGVRQAEASFFLHHREWKF